MKTTTGKINSKDPIQRSPYRSALTFLTLTMLLISANSIQAKDDDKSGKKVQNRTDKITQCEKWYVLVTNDTSSKPWHNLLSKNGTYLETLYAQSAGVDPIFTIAQKEGGDPASTYKSVLKKIASCEAYVASTVASNYDSKDLMGTKKGDGEDDSVNTQMLQCMSQADQAAQATCMQQAQKAGNMTCKHEGAETHDYLACKKLATFVKGFTVGKSAMQLQQTFRVGNAAIDAQENLMQKQNTEEGIGMADTLTVQRDSLEQQGNMAYEMAAYNAAKAGILLSMISAFPTREEMYNRCVSNLNSQKVSQTYEDNIQKPRFGAATADGTDATSQVGTTSGEQAGPPAEAGAADPNSWYAQLASTEAKSLDTLFADEPSVGFVYNGQQTEDICNEVLLNDPDDNFFLNQDILDKVKEVAMAAGLEAVANGAQGMLLKKQAGIVDDAIDDIEEFEKPEFEQAGFEPTLTSECVVDPQAEGCITWGGGTTSGFGSQNFGSSVNGSANLGSGSLGSDDSDGASSASATKRNLLPNSVGSVQIGVPGKTGFSDGVVRPGSIKPGKANGAGGGGGGGAPGGGGGGGAAGGGGSGAQAASGGSGKSAIKVGMNGSGLGRVSGGRGSIGKKSSSSSANPFAKLLGKTASKGNTLNFRGPAQIGKEKGSLFQRISSRYQAVSKADKLLKYEAKEEKK